MPQRDWGGWSAAARAAETVSSDQEPVVACPKCGTPVDRNRAGWANCPLGHWRSDGPDPKWADYTPG